MHDGTCIVCGAPLKQKHRKYCSFACLGDDRRKSVQVTCPCGAEFEAPAAKVAVGKGKYCSKTCFYTYRRPRPSGLTYSVVKDNPTKFTSGGTSGANNWRWKGGPGNRYSDRPGYKGIHEVVKRRFGKAADYNCAFADATCRGRMEWACVSNEYRDSNDFMPLCGSHHQRYDGGLL